MIANHYMRSLAVLLLALPLLSCEQTYELSDFQGEWTGPTKEITLRWEPRPWRYLYYQGDAELRLLIDNKGISGHLGDAKLKSIDIIRSRPATKAQPAILEFAAEVEKVFDDDPIPEKELTFLLTLNSIRQIESTIEMGQFGSEFQVGNMLLESVK